MMWGRPDQLQTTRDSIYQLDRQERGEVRVHTATRIGSVKTATTTLTVDNR